MPGRHAAPQAGMAEALVLTGLRLCYIDLYLILSGDMPERQDLMEGFINGF